MKKEINPHITSSYLHSHTRTTVCRSDRILIMDLSNFFLPQLTSNIYLFMLNMYMNSLVQSKCSIKATLIYLSHWKAFNACLPFCKIAASTHTHVYLNYIRKTRFYVNYINIWIVWDLEDFFLSLFVPFAYLPLMWKARFFFSWSPLNLLILVLSALFQCLYTIYNQVHGTESNPIKKQTHTYEKLLYIIYIFHHVT